MEGNSNQNNSMVEATTQPVQEPTTQSPQVNDNQKPEKDGSALGTIFGFIFMGMLVFGFLFMGEFNDWVNEKFPKVAETVGIDKDNDAEGPARTTVQPDDYSGYYKTLYSIDPETLGTRVLILRRDNTFLYDNTLSDCYNPIVGIYTVDADRITFEGKVRYSCDKCIVKDDPTVTSFNGVASKDKIVTDQEFTKDTNSTETTEDLTTYVVNGTICE